MGTDIHGWIEIKPIYDNDDLEPVWYAVIDVGILFDRDYDLFGSLFGVRNKSGFEPLAAGRGLPPHVTEECDFDPDEAIHSYTWISLAELRRANWEEQTQITRPAWEERILEDGAILRCRRGEMQVETVTRREMLGDAGRFVLDMMEVLAKRYREDCVRLVVYFDN